MVPFSRAEVEGLLPLSPVAFHILISLAREDRHGYAIIQEVAERTGGRLRLSAGSLYRTVHRLLEDGLVVETRERPAPEQDDARRRYYRITPFGAAVARVEAHRMSELLAAARARGLVLGKA